MTLTLGLKSGHKFIEIYDGLFSEDTARQLAEASLRRLGSTKAGES